MNIHKNARMTVHGRALLVSRVLEQGGQRCRCRRRRSASAQRTAYKWLARYRAGGEPALKDRSSAPARQRRLPAEQVAAIERCGGSA